MIPQGSRVDKRGKLYAVELAFKLIEKGSNQRRPIGSTITG